MYYREFYFEYFIVITNYSLECFQNSAGKLPDGLFKSVEGYYQNRIVIFPQ